MNPATATNATKGLLTMGLLLLVEGVEVFGVYDFSDAQGDYLTRGITFVGVLWLALTYRLSKKRKVNE